MKMKLTLALAVVAIAAASFAVVQQEKNLAQVEQIQGLYVFVKSKPVNEYEFLGSVKPGAMGNHEFDNLLQMTIKKAKKEYPQADAILFDGSINQTHNTIVSVIKFKE